MSALLQGDGVGQIIQAYCESSRDAFEELLAPALNRFLECEQADDPDALDCPEGSGDALLDEAPVDGACDPPLKYELQSVEFRDGDDIACGAEFAPDALTIPLTMPDIIFVLHVTGGAGVRVAFGASTCCAGDHPDRPAR
jgi:hypothetical protein